MIHVSEDRSQAQGQTVVWFGPTADSLEDRQTNSDGQVGRHTGRGAAGMAVRWKAAAEDSDWHVGMKV